MSKNIAVYIANSVDPDQTPHSAASDLGLYCLQRPICPNTLGYYVCVIVVNSHQTDAAYCNIKSKLTLFAQASLRDRSLPGLTTSFHGD